MTFELLQAGRAGSGCTLQVVYCDEGGHTHTMLVHSTESEDTIMARGAQQRAAMEKYYEGLGCTLISAQVLMRSSNCVFEAAGSEAAPKARHLRLATVDGKRILSPDVQLLAASAGIDPKDVFGE